MATAPNHQQPTEDLRDGSALCLACGLCCHGVLHHDAVLQENEVEAAKALGLEVQRTPDSLGFALPCPRVVGNTCSIYAQRLSTCSSYRCGMLKRYQRSEISLDEALPLIDEARRLFQSAEAAVPQGWTFRQLRWKLRRWTRKQPDGELTAQEAEELKQPFLLATMLDLFLDRHFRLEEEMMLMGSSDRGSKVGLNEGSERSQG